MFDEIMFHGTNNKSGRLFLTEQELKKSTGERHWLGDGIYFFEEDFHAYKWIRDMHIVKNGCFNEKKFHHDYLILKARLSTKKNRVFDLTKIEHKIIFDYVLSRMRKKDSSEKYIDSVVLNYIFIKLNYNNDFDMVRAVFQRNSQNYRKAKTRLNFLPQIQVCVKNKDIVSDIETYSYEHRAEDFTYMLENYYYEGNKSNTFGSYNKKNNNVVYPLKK